MIATAARSSPKRGKAPSGKAAIITLMNSSASATAEESGHLPDIPFLEDDGNDFAFWKFRVEMALSLQDLWGVVSGMDKMPDATANPKGFAEWKSRDRKARAQITLALKDGPFYSVLDATTARECWERVSDYCKQIAEDQKPLLMDKLFRTTLSDSKPLEPQIEELLRAARVLSNAGPGFEDKMIAFFIIISLPPSLSTLKAILSGTELSKLSSQYIISMVVVDEQRRIRDSGVDAVAYFANAARKGRGKGKGKGKGKKK